YLELKYRILNAELHSASLKSGEYEPTMTYQYANNRSQMWWEFRLALDPASGFRISLPPSKRLLTQLTTPHFFYRGDQLFIESKDQLRTRIGGSTDEAEAVMGAWQYRDIALARRVNPEYDLIERMNGREPTGDP